MGEILGWGVFVIVSGAGLDRLLLHLEERGWINYRKHGLSRGAIAYHMLELQSTVQPGALQVLEALHHEEVQEDESGDPE
jgi:hypothetical protein